MALWTPANLAVPPKVWWDGDTAVFSGSNLSSWGNAGSFGGSATVNGPPTKASTLNGLNGVAATSTGQNLTQSMAFGTSGQMFIFSVADLPETAGGATHGLCSDGNGVVAAGSVAVYLSVGDPGGGIFAGANGYAGSPFLDAFPATFGSGPKLHGIQLGSTQGHWVDGTAQALTDDSPATVPSYTASSTWVYLDSFNPNTGEQLNGSMYQYLLLTYFPTTAERQLLEGWAAWKYGLQADLPIGHPWKSAAPQYVPTVAVPKGSLAFTGLAPSLVGNSAVAVPKGSFAYSGKTPSLVTPSAIAVPKGTLAFTGFAPSIGSGSSVAVPKGSLAYTGFAPSFMNASTVTVPKGALTFTGKVPTIANSGSTVIVPRGHLAFSGYAPTLLPIKRDLILIPVTNSLDVVRRNANAALELLQDMLPGYGTVLPNVSDTPDGRLFCKTNEAVIYQLQNGAWVAQDGTP